MSNDVGRWKGRRVQLSSEPLLSNLLLPWRPIRIQSSSSAPPPLLVPGFSPCNPFFFFLVAAPCLNTPSESSLLTSWNLYFGRGPALALLRSPPFRGRLTIHYDGQPRRLVAAGQYCGKDKETKTTQKPRTDGLYSGRSDRGPRLDQPASHRAYTPTQVPPPRRREAAL